MFFTRISVLPVSALLVASACSSETRAGSDRADEADELCESAALDEAGVCRTPDGKFAPAECCAKGNAICGVDTDPVFDEDDFVAGKNTSEKLEKFVVGIPAEITPAEIASLTNLERNQIVAAMRQLDLIGEDDDVTDAVKAVDDDTVELRKLSMVDQSEDGSFAFFGTWVTASAGDTEIGAVFADGTLELVATVSDGDVLGCKSATPAGLVCDDVSLDSVSEIDFGGGNEQFDIWHDCWVDDAICYGGPIGAAQTMLEKLFEELWSGDREIEDLRIEGDDIVLESVGEDGLRVLTLTPCD